MRLEKREKLGGTSPERFVTRTDRFVLRQLFQIAGDQHMRFSCERRIRADMRYEAGGVVHPQGAIECAGHCRVRCVDRQRLLLGAGYGD